MSKSYEETEFEDDSEMDEESFESPSSEKALVLSEEFWAEFGRLKNPHLATLKNPVKKETSRMKEAFLFWALMPDGSRTYKAVGDKFNVTSAIVGRWGKSFNWDGRLEVMRQQDLERFKEAESSNLSNDLTRMVSSARLAMQKFDKDIQSNSLKISVNDFINIGKFLVSIRKELSGDNSAGSSEALRQIDGLMSTIGGDVNTLLVNFVNATINNNETLPHDELLEAKAAQIIENAAEQEEAGDSEEEEDEFDEATLD
jgi:hypothetical protein